MKGITKFVVTLLALVIVFGVVGNVILDMFPQTQPLWDEMKEIFSEIWGYTSAKYGVVVAFVILVFIGILIGTSN